MATTYFNFNLLFALNQMFPASRKMVKEARSMQEVEEVAPALLISCKRCSSCPKLDTIVEEEGSESFEILPKRMMFFLPVLVSFVSYLLLNKCISYGTFSIIN